MYIEQRLSHICFWILYLTLMWWLFNLTIAVADLNYFSTIIKFYQNLYSQYRVVDTGDSQVKPTRLGWQPLKMAATLREFGQYRALFSIQFTNCWEVKGCLQSLIFVPNKYYKQHAIQLTNKVTPTHYNKNSRLNCMMSLLQHNIWTRSKLFK